MTKDIDEFDDAHIDGVADEILDAEPTAAGKRAKSAPRIADLVAPDQQRSIRGHFLPGNQISRGMSNRRRAKLAADLLEPHRKEILQRALDVAFDATNPNASVGAIRLLLERLLGAVPRPDDELAPVEGLAEAKGLQAKAETVVNAAGRGEISPAAARALLGSLADAARIATGDELVGRIERLEQALQARTVDAPR